jgi:LysM repeat protein
MNFKKYFLFISIIIAFATALPAQTEDYLLHTIKKGETLSSLAKKFHTTVGNIMRLNSMNSKSVLKLGQKVKIPINSDDVVVKDTTRHLLKATVATQEAVFETTTQPQNAITYKVQPKETLYSIAQKNHVSVSQIKKWNSLKNDNIQTGQKLMVGIQPQESAARSAAPKLIVKPGRPDNDPNQPKATITESAEEIKTPVKVAEEKNKPATLFEEQTIQATNAYAEGFFKSEYNEKGQEAMGTAATFKSASGWADKKFYVLINKIDAGTVISLSSNNKTIYAKVLGALPDIKEDNGLLLRLSNAAAAALGVADKFDVIINY